jgi:hypothetical protein
MMRSTIINIVLKDSRSISNSLIMPPIVTRSRLQVVSMGMERERGEDDDGDGGGGAAVPLSSDEMYLSLCVTLFYNVSICGDYVANFILVPS